MNLIDTLPKFPSTVWDRYPMPDGFVWRAFFPNGYGVSVAMHRGSYGGREGLAELAIIVGSLESWQFAGPTPVIGGPDDVEGWLTMSELTDMIVQTYNLPPR